MQESLQGTKTWNSHALVASVLLGQKQRWPSLQEEEEALLQNSPFVKMEFSVGAWGSNFPKGAPCPLNCLHF